MQHQIPGTRRCGSRPTEPAAEAPGPLRRAWFALCRNRFAIAIASLIWLLWRSGPQPRRLAYPCQQAAAANLGFLAVLFVPALARCRRHGAAPSRFALATGSVALAGVLFLLVNAGRQVYCEWVATWTPGNPAVIPWTPVSVAEPAVMSSRVPAPTDAEAVVAVNRNPAVLYGTEPYGPGQNTAYDLIWKTVADLHLGPPASPLADLIQDRDGDGKVEVLIKPNTVWYYANNGSERNPVYSHPATLRPLIDMAAAAGATDIWVGDGSDGGGNLFTAKFDPMGFTENYFNQLRALWPGVNISRVDFQNLQKWRWVGLGTEAGGASAYVGSGYTSNDLQKIQDGAATSYFAAADPHGKAGPGKNNCMGWLAITDYIFDADTIIDLAKLKVHYHDPVTIATKNWVGITMFSTFGMYQNYWSRVAHNRSDATNYEKDFGNDILWRELVDAHRAALYFRDGVVHSTPQRGYLCVVDAINAAERYHVPNQPIPYWLHTVLAGVSPVAVDAVAMRLQRYDFRWAPIANNAHASSIGSNWPLGTADPGRLRIVGDAMIDQSYDHVFQYETANDPGQSWPDWTLMTIQDLTPPNITSVQSEDLGGGMWRVTARITGGHAAFYYYGDDGTGAPLVVRLGRSGDTYSADIAGPAGTGLLVAQDDRFNTARLHLVDMPVIGLDPRTVSRSGRCRQTLEPAVLQVFNMGTGTLNFTVEVEPAARGWLSAAPASGSSTGDPVPITLTFDTSQVAPGTHQGLVTVSDPAAYNPTETMTVTITLTGIRSDFDSDGDVDLADYAVVQRCLSGWGIPQADPTCQVARIDADDDVDQDDVGLFLGCMDGSNVARSPGCTAP